MRACFLALMGLDAANDNQTQHVCGVWLQALFHLGRVEESAVVAAVLGSENYIVERFIRRYAMEGVAVPVAEDETEMLDEAVAFIARLVAPMYDLIRVAEDAREHRGMIVAALRDAARALSINRSIFSAIASLESST